MIALLLAAALAWPPGPNQPSGAINPAVTQENIATTICTHGWTATIRPTRHEAWAIKRKLLHGHRAKGTVLDHVVPLEAGGAPRDPANLQIQTRAAARRKDHIEHLARVAICTGRITLQQGQAAFLH